MDDGPTETHPVPLYRVCHQYPPMGTDPVVQSILHQASYLSCSPSSDPNDVIDILGFNIYNWCSKADTYVTSGYQAVQQEFLKSGVRVPVMLSEYGCNEWDYLSGYPWTSNYRQWLQVPTIFDPQQMASSFSGGIAYTLVMAPNAKAARVRSACGHMFIVLFS